ncbi:MAG: HAMP domain-containing protein [Alphaproteobacteria bacterium]|nr:HAMP domain-containing protein [Alphaproteobacteria bacterium]
MGNLPMSLSSIRVKLVALLLLFGLVPVAVVAAFFELERPVLEDAAMDRLEDTAISVSDKIDRNLFERYGDVQAFLINTIVPDRTNWAKPSPENPLLVAIDGYMQAYGLYKMMVLVDPAGKVLAVNRTDPAGKPLDTASLYQQSFAGANWLKRALAEDYLKGTNGLTGTVVEPASPDATLAKLYKDDGWSIVFAAPLKDKDGKIIAVWANYADFGLVEQIVGASQKIMAGNGLASAEITVIDSKGNVIVDYDPAKLKNGVYARDPEIVGKFNLASGGVAAAQLAIKGGHGMSKSMHARKKIEQAGGYAHGTGAYDYPGLGWSVLVRVPVDEAFAGIDNVSRIIFGVVAASLVVILLGGLAIGSIAVRPINALTNAMVALAGGNYETEVPGVGRKDELGAMAASVQVFKDNGIEAQRLRAQQERLAEEAEQQKKKALMDMAETVERETANAVEQIATSTHQVTGAAEGMSKLAEEVSADSQAVAAASEEALVNAQTVSSAAEELSASIREISGQVARASTVTRTAVDSSEKAQTTIRSLSDAVTKISEVTKLIGQIAGQTNLLALNATIEAARAGDAGKGFAVVASEVKNLANQTGRSTEDIDRQVGEIQTATEAAVNAVAEIGERIREIDQVASAIAAAMEEQGAATQEIARNVGQTAEAAREVSSKIQNVSREADTVGTRATEVRTAIGSVSSSLDELKRILVRVVRTSTTDADRRKYPRYAVRATIDVTDGAGKKLPAKLIDCSEGGAHFSCEGAMNQGERGAIRFEGVSGSLSFVVRYRESNGSVHVEFPAGTAGGGYADWLRQRSAGLRPVDAA